MNFCDICGSGNGNIEVVEERMFGSSEEFKYFACNQCGGLTLLNPPEDWSKFYPVNYYSYGEFKAEKLENKCRIREWLSCKRNEAIVFSKKNFFALLARNRPSSVAFYVKEWLQHSPERLFPRRVLDVGCGSGSRICQMRKAGVENLVGIDPYVESTRRIAEGVTVRQQSLEEVTDGSFDLVMLHHTLEHMKNHEGVLRKIRDLLTPDGYCLIRTPLAQNDARDQYGKLWVDWDAPRHLVLHTQSSLKYTAGKSGYEVARIAYDTTAFVYWGSELYRRGMSLVDPATGKIRTPERHFKASEMRGFQQKAEDANSRGMAGRGIFWLRPRDEREGDSL